jgi:hypothetical protein
VIGLGSSLLDFPANSVLSYVEGIVREISEENDNAMNDLYDLALMNGRGDSRRHAIMEAMAVFGGD